MAGMATVHNHIFGIFLMRQHVIASIPKELLKQRNWMAEISERTGVWCCH